MNKVTFPIFAATIALILAPVMPWAQETKKPASPLATAVADPKQEKLPSAREVLDKAVEKMGGKETFKKYKSQRAAGKYSIPAQQLNGDIEIFAAAPNKLLIKIQLPGIGAIDTGYNGKVGWQLNAITGPMLLEDKTLEQVASQADFYSTLHDDSKFSSMETVGKETFEGKECYKVKLVEKSGVESTEFYSIESGLQVGSITKQESPFGAAVVTSVVEDYKKVGGLLLPGKVIQKLSGMVQTITMDTVEFDTVDQAVFELPKEIKNLVEAKKESPAPVK